MEIKLNNSTTTNVGDIQKFSINQSPLMFSILSEKLYSNPIKAIVRELLTNAHDSHVVAKTDKAIDVTLPSVLEMNFTIRDYGTGLSEKDMMQLYTTFFGSNKNQDNNLTGGFGLGSKTPFAYTETFFVNSYYNGIVGRYVLFKNNDYPSITKLLEEPTNEPNGLEITIAVDKHDTNKFFSEVEFFCSFNPEVLINLSENEDREFNITEKIANFNKYTWYNCNTSYFKQGQNVFSLEDIFNNLTHEDELKFKEEIPLNIEDIKKEGIVIEVPIGTLSITPNREYIHLTKDTINTLFNELMDYCKYLTENVDELVKYGISSVLPAYLKTIQFKQFEFTNKLDYYSEPKTLYFCTLDKIKSTYRSYSKQLQESKSYIAGKERYNFKISPTNNNKPYYFILINDITSYQESKLKRAVNYAGQQSNAEILTINVNNFYNEYKEDLDKIQNILTNSVYNVTIKIYTLDEFNEEFLPKNLEKILQTSYRVGTARFTNVGKDRDHNLLYFHSGLVTVESFDNTSNVDKFKVLISANENKEKLAKSLRNITGFNNDTNTLFKFIEDKYDKKDLKHFVINFCHKEAYKNSILPEFDMEEYEKYVEKLNNVPNYIKPILNDIPEISLFLEAIDKITKGKVYNVILKSKEYKILKMLSKYNNKLFVFKNDYNHKKHPLIQKYLKNIVLPSENNLLAVLNNDINDKTYQYERIRVGNSIKKLYKTTIKGNNYNENN